MRPRPREPGSGDDDDGTVAVQHGELTPVGDGRLVDVAGEDELRACLGEQREHVAAPRERALPCAPRGVRELVVEANHPQRTRWSLGEACCDSGQGVGAQAAGLMAPGSHRVQADDVKPVCAVNGFGLAPHPLELSPRMGEAAGWQERDVVVSGNDEHGRAEAAQEGCGGLVLVRQAAMCEVTRGHDEVRPDAVDQDPERGLHTWPFTGARVEVGDVDETRGHGRGRLYTDSVADEPTELFDDLYLGLRAGGAMRKQRRGEPLTMEEEAALNRWQRLSSWRKTIAVGAFALGTFGLGFTLGGLVFGRGRKAKA